MRNDVLQKALMEDLYALQCDEDPMLAVSPFLFAKVVGREFFVGTCKS